MAELSSSISSFPSYDGTRLAWHAGGRGEPLVCLPGGPMLPSGYLGDLGGLTAHRTLIRLDLRGSGASAVPDDPSTYRCDRQVADVEALRERLGLERMDLLGHSASGNLALLYAARHPARVRRLVLVTPGLRALGLASTAADRVAAIERRREEPWYAGARAALDRLEAGEDDEELWNATAPFYYGRWDEDARTHWAAVLSEADDEAAEVYYQDGAFDPEGLRTALARFDAPVLIMAGGLDFNPTPARARAAAGLLPAADVVDVPGAGHYPWLDDPESFVLRIAEFLRADVGGGVRSQE